MPTMTKTRKPSLYEFSYLGDNAVIDDGGSILRNVRVIGRKSRNGREYPLPVLREAIPLFEGCLVNVDHDLSGRNRSYEDNIGVLKNVREDAEGLMADLHLKPTHELYESIKWDYKHATKKIGLSFFGDGPVVNGIVTKIDSVTEVDLVLNPATAKSLVESEEPEEKPEAPADKVDYTKREHEMVMGHDAKLVEHDEKLADHESKLAECMDSMKKAESEMMGRLKSALAEIEMLSGKKAVHIHPDLKKRAADLDDFVQDIKPRR